ncbi:3-phosphoshikimate 1-carboxyvinyltransferase [Streptomyces sp. APSN-46.1]|uniref:3-phosphoshikimate 1-carboxyvinyltransferase n=1 Tax=Streptomyces sp. APSN-46.1 TaxID=2929049 RepID=UPI001FB37954|nr:3-phosphoshikimate 1-carboxyvinyltransferase [Streptomyces sp. APSN-46.1]MCJ1678540.1 3-phosphoshikimate 1-carboxyvinyltransferase [Streptomyces sp. APSN-46.1]
MTARVPGSKSITNRALLLAAAAAGVTRLRAPLVSDDTLAFRTALTGLGIRITDAGDTWEITGTGHGPATGTATGTGPATGTGTAADADADATSHGPATAAGTVWCADAGTAARFLPPFAAAGRGRFVFDGTDQLRARPLRPLAEALRTLGAEVATGPDGGLPLTVTASGLAGGDITLDSSFSSQYLTGLLLSAPLMTAPLTVRARSLVSRPYIDMTLALMHHFGARAEDHGDGTITVLPGGYTAADLPIEPDASTASYFFAAAAVTGRSVTVPGLGSASSQGDLGFVEVLRRTGAHVEITESATTVTGRPDGSLTGGFDVDMGNISDTFMTLAAIAPLADGPITVHGIGHARLKESDRIEAVARNLRALGIHTEEGPDRITIHPGTPKPAQIACYRDHRIAMAFSVLGLRTGGITLDDPSCVSKTFPGFHDELRRLFPGAATSHATSPATSQGI